MKTVKKLIPCMLVVILLTAILIGCGTKQTSNPEETSMQQSKPKIGIVYTSSGRGDLSFNDATYEGALRAEKELGVIVDNVEPKSPSETEMAIEEMSASGEYELIIGITFEALDPISRIAPEYPDQKYALIDVETELENVVSYIAKENESAFLVGSLAALLQEYRPNDMITDSKTVGVLGAMDAAVVNRHIAGFTSGARYIDPDMKVLYDYVGGFNDTATGQAISETMFNKGANIIYNASAGSGLGMFKAAEDKGFIGIGLDSNQNHINPEHIVASSLKNVDEFVYSAISDVLNDTFKGGQTFYLGLAEEGVGYTLEQSNIKVDDEIVRILEDIKQKVVSGEIVVPTVIDEVEEFVTSNHYEGNR